MSGRTASDDRQCDVHERSQSPQLGSKKLVIEEMKSMRIFRVLVAGFFLTVLTAHAQSDKAAGPPVPDRSYKLLRNDEDWTFLRAPTLRQDFWDPIKYIPLRNRVDDWYLTMGGEAREVWEQIGRASCRERVSCCV